MFVVDLRHFLDLPDDAPGPARRLAEQLRCLVRAATAAEAGAAWLSALPCRRRPGNRRCDGRMIVQRDDVSGSIGWECSSCGDAGVISGWDESADDLRGGLSRASVRLNRVRITDEVAAALRDMTLLDPDCERVVYRTRADGNDLVLTASDGELDELIGCVAAEANHEPNRRRQQRLDIVFDVLKDAAEDPNESPAAPAASDCGPGGAPRRTGASATSIPELDIARVQRWCADRVPEHARHQVRVECQVAARHLTIVERRAPWRAESGPEWTSFPIARLGYAKTTRSWTLYWRDRNLRFHAYDQLAPTPHVEDVLAEVERDPTCMFWG